MLTMRWVMMALPLVAVEGTPGECGHAYGRSAAALVKGNVQAYGRRFLAHAGLTRAAVRRAGAGYRATTLELQPRIATMLDALAEGAGVAVEDLYALNARTELLYGATPAECTSVGVLDRQSASGHTVLGQNWDWHPDQRPYALLLATRDERGFAVVTLAEAGMLAKAGVNSAGLGVCVNMLGTDRDGGRAGLPYHVLVRAVLEADCLALALRAVCPMPRSASINVMLGQSGPGWGGGEIIDLELVPGDLGILHPVDGLLAHANHIETDLPLRDTLKDLGGSSYFRSARAARLLRRVATAGQVASEDLVALLSDHGGYPHAICRHVDPRDSDDERSQTICSVLLDLDERRISIAAGQPCRTAYQDLRLDRLFDRPASPTAEDAGQPDGRTDGAGAQRVLERLD